MSLGSDRSVTLTVGAKLDGLVSEFTRGSRAGQEFSRSMVASAKAAARGLHDVKDEAREVAVPLLAIGTVAAAGVGLAIKSYADFSERMASVKSLSHATADEQAKLKDAALTAGTAIGYSATQAADAEIELVKAGVSASDIYGGALAGSLKLAAAGQLDVADATGIAAATLVQFNLKGRDVGHVADLLAAGADKALGSVQDLGQGLKYIGPVAAANKVPLEQTVGALSLLASNAILGEQGGTALRGVLQSLVSPSKVAADTMKQYGINVYDAQGKFVGFNGAAEQLHQRIGGLDQATRNQALGQIFGNEQITAATVLMDGGASAVDKWTAAVNEQGFATEQAAGKMDNLNGDLQKLQASFQTALILTGESADGPLRAGVEAVTDLVNAYNDLPPALQGVVLGSGVLVSAVTLSAGTMLLAVPKVVEFSRALHVLAASNIPAVSRAARIALASTSLLGKGLGATAGVLSGPWGAAALVAAAAVTVFVAKQVEASRRTAELKSTLDETTGAVTEATRGMIAANLASKGSFLGIDVGPSALEQAKNAGLSLETVTKAAEGNAKAYKELKAAQKELDDARGVGNLDANNAAKAADAVVRKVDEQRAALGGAKDQQKLLNEAQADSKDSSDKAAAGLDGVTSAADDAAKAIDDTANALKGLTSGQLDVNSTQRAFEQAIDDATEALKKNRAGLNDTHDGFKLTEQTGRDAASAVDDLAQKTLDSASALYQQTGSQEQAAAALQKGRDELQQQLMQYGFTEAGAKAYADQVVQTPTGWATVFTNNANGASDLVFRYLQKLDDLPAEKRTNVVAATTAAQLGIQSVLDTLSKIPTQKTVTITTNRVNVGTPDNTVGIFKPNGKAAGGEIRGPGTGTSDDVPIWASNGEWVVRERAASMYGPRTMSAINAGLVDPVALGTLVAGGLTSAVAIAGQSVKSKAVATHWGAGAYASGGPVLTPAQYAAPKSQINVQVLGSSEPQPLVGKVDMTFAAGTPRQGIDELMFRLRTLDRGGR